MSTKSSGEERTIGNWFEYFYPKPDEALAAGRLQLKFDSLSAVQEWVDAFKTDGDAFLRVGLAGRAEVDDLSRRLAELWLAEHQRKLDASLYASELNAAFDAALAAKESARWAKWAAVATALGAIVSALGAYFAASTPPPAAQIFIQPAAKSSVITGG
ncbi:MAG: hypothetical protein LBJ15_00845 [Comamonas sp.]|jgi:hypothetical protein|uniref:hypothetical protein n=1 Tax=Comamonas sp. TaxID=34028 RepID=UPI0028244B09|nr:hypothetical protein [Comamonas sp.]MDR0212534.1 hypothetical protein [Comamonas sp.]